MDVGGNSAGSQNGKECGCHSSGDEGPTPPSLSNHPEHDSDDDGEETAPVKDSFPDPG